MLGAIVGEIIGSRFEGSGYKSKDFDLIHPHCRFTDDTVLTCAVADWLHRTVAGLVPAEPGYRRILVSPRPGGRLTSASAAHETPYGRAEVGWTRAADRMAVTVLVPPGTTAVVRLPAPEWAEVTVGSGRHAFACRFRPASDDPVASDDNGANGTDR